jgi:formamidopyrimidine-DNA glycosylase
MPELPEVETIIGDLREEILEREITGVSFLSRSVWRTRVPSPKMLVGARVSRIDRRGKNILILLSNGNVLIIHLKMTGRLTYEKRRESVAKHTHLIVDLDGGQLRFNDVRRFGYLDLVRADRLGAVDYLQALGPDAIQISREEFVKLLKSKRRIIKALLMDQTVLAGLGNIYSDEALHLARIHPRRISSSLNVKRITRLYDAMRKTLLKALAARGSSVDSYVDARGFKGSFQNQHLVYGREGLPCRTCGRPIRRIIVGSRSSHFCPRCQR